MTMRRSEAGLTMVEVSIILVILAILAVAFLPTMGNILAVTKTKGASEEMAMAIRQTRQLAITRAVNHCISFPANNQYQIWETSCGGTSVEGPVTLSQGATVSDASQTFTFNPIGTTTAGTVTINITDPSACSVILTVTAAGGVQLASPPC
ncbi:MAG: GspH/FimT family pseudopilin [Candidatus Rokubacteria bacterium]|nr:GspH/FimT family pseudopilin [Candidatus Rokubacteria bacterium]